MVVCCGLLACGSDPEPKGTETKGIESPSSPRSGSTPISRKNSSTVRPTFSGLPTRRLRAELDLESALRDRVRAQNCDDHLKELTQTPRLAGSKDSERVAAYLDATLESWGYQVERHEYLVLLPIPVRIVVEMSEPVVFSASIREAPIDRDLDTQHGDAILPYNAYSPDCDLDAPVVYANYGRREDYARLEEMGVRFRGAIVVARYGKIFRGSKAAIAEEMGAAALLLYSDPADDGFFRGDVYPAGPYRPKGAVERGSILHTFVYPGDPGTPGRPSLDDAEQLTYEEMGSLPQLPTTCLSAVDIEPILSHLKGPTVPSGWQGALGFTYHVGGSRFVNVHLLLEMDSALRRISNVVATRPGIEYPDEEIIIGNHRDAWVRGAVDAGSGTAVLMETARALAEAADQGQGPKRTVRFAFWDAEEFGMIGSTEWGEQFKERLQKQCVAYINLDSAVSGRQLRASGVPSLRSFLGELLRSVPGPRGSNRAEELEDEAGTIRFGRLGSGSDYTVFLEHLGIASMDLASTGPYGVYHSAADTYRYLDTFSDPDFSEHARMCRLLSTVVSRLARVDLLPFDYESYGRDIRESAQAVESKFPSLDLGEIANLGSEIATAGKAINGARRALLEKDLPLEARNELNGRLFRAERRLLMKNGLPDRPWYRHALAAPDPDLGYGAALLPPLTDALRTGDRNRIQNAGTNLASTLRGFLSELTALRLAMERRLPAALGN